MVKSNKGKKASRKSAQQADGIRRVKRTVVLAVTKLAADTGNYRNVKLADFVGSADFTSLFTQYRISKVCYKYCLVNAPNNNASFPTLYVTPQQYFYSGTPTSRDDVLQYQGLEVIQFGPAKVAHSVTTVPGTFVDASGLVGGGVPTKSPWLSTANNGNQHFTIVDWISRYNTTSDPTHTLELQITAWFDLKGTR